MGPSVLNVFAEAREDWFPMVSDIALTMLGFLIGGAMTTQLFREQGKQIRVLSLGIAAGTFAVVLSGILALGESLLLAFLLAAIATATDPAATTDVVLEEGCEHSRFGRRLLGIVAADDAWGLIIFSLCMVLAAGIESSSTDVSLLTGLWEIGGAVALGVAIGLPMAFLTGRIREGEPILVEALGLVFLCAGLAMKLEVSFLLASVVMGATVTNLAQSCGGRQNWRRHAVSSRCCGGHGPDSKQCLPRAWRTVADHRACIDGSVRVARASGRALVVAGRNRPADNRQVNCCLRPLRWVLRRCHHQPSARCRSCSRRPRCWRAAAGALSGLPSRPCAAPGWS